MGVHLTRKSKSKRVKKNIKVGRSGENEEVKGKEQELT